MRRLTLLLSPGILWLLITVLPMPGRAAPPLSVTQNSQFYYDIGGASSITAPLNAAAQTQLLNGAAELGFGYSCGKFDPTLGIANLLNQLGGLGNKLINGAIGAVTAAIGSLPALVLQRINPGLYDLFQNGLIRVEAMLALANTSCEDMESQIKQGKNPYKDWVNISKSLDWKVQMGQGSYGSSSKDVVQAKEKVETNNGASGVTWTNGARAGGQGQPPIKTTEDVVHAGFELSMNTSGVASGPFKISLPKLPGLGTPPPSTLPPRLKEIWPTKEEASTWAVEVVGDTYIRTHENHQTETVAGHGLLPKIQQAHETTQKELALLVQGTSEANLENLGKVSSDSMQMTESVIMAIRNLEPNQQTLLINKLSSEVAMAQTLEKAFFLRRLLLTGKLEPNVGKTPAPKVVDDTVAVLDQEIENILFEKRVRKELMSNTSSILLSLTDQIKNQGRTRHEQPGRDQKLLIDSAVK